MPYQLVIQFRGDSVEDLDMLVALEDALIVQLGETAEVDGHDMGSGEGNIFIYTPTPVETFAVVQPILARASLLSKATVAYRPLDSEEFTIVWPEHCTRTFNVA